VLLALLGVNTMLNVNWTIDYIQQSKKQFVDATVTNDVIRKGLHEFVDKQTELCKVITNNAVVFTKELTSLVLPSTNICKP
jgi:hypothetical protein